MKKFIKCFLIASLFVAFLSADYYAQDLNRKKMAQTGMKFMNATIDARAAGLNEAVTALEGGAAFWYTNPASLARTENFADVALGQMNWIADIKYLYGSAAFVPLDIRYGVIGVTAMSVNYGTFYETVLSTSEQGFTELGTFSPYAFSFGVSYANALSDKFSFGANIKYAKQSLGGAYTVYSDAEQTKQDNVRDVLAFDFGLIYKTGYKSLNFAMVVKNFSKEVTYEEENFQLPLTFRIGLSMDAMDLFNGVDKSMHSLLIGVDAVHYRDYEEQVNLGAEYTFMNTISLRAGLSAPNDERSYSLGVGLKQSYQSYSLGVDYAYAPFGIFDAVHRISVRFGL